MTVQHFNSDTSDDSEDMVSLPSEEDVHLRKYQLLLERCEVLQQDNERIVNRIHQVKKITKRYRKDIKLLVSRLDKHGDGFRTALGDIDIDTRPAPETPKPQAPVVRQEKPEKKKAQKRKSKGEKPERDPNAPKKPCNAFFQFCQEQRPMVVAQTNEQGTEPTKAEVTKQLASRWRSLSYDEKRVYVAMFERSKEKYAEEMSAYVKKEQ